MPLIVFILLVSCATSLAQQVSYQTDSLSSQYPLIKSKQDNYFGFVNQVGKIIIPHQYDDAADFQEGLAVVQEGIFYGFIDSTSKTVIAPQYDFAWNFESGRAAIKQQGRFGFIDTTGKIIIPCIYDHIYTFSHDRNTELPKDGPLDWDEVEQLIYRPKLYIDKKANFFEEGLARVQRGEKYGFLDRNGKEIIPLKYDHVWNFSEGLAGVQRKGKAGFINKKGKKIIPFIYDYVWPFSNGLAKVEKDKKVGFINKKGKLIVPIEYDYASSFKLDKSIVVKDRLYGMINKKGKFILPMQYDLLQAFQSSILAKKERLYGLFSTTGQAITPIQYYQIDSSFHKGFIRVQSSNNRMGVITTQGKEVIPILYHAIFPRDSNIFLVKQHQRCGAFDLTGKELVSCIYTNIDYRNNWFILRNHQSTKIYCLTDSQSYSFDVHNCSFVGEQFIKLQYQNHTYQLFDLQKRALTPGIYQQIMPFSEGYAAVSQKGKVGYIDTIGQIILPPIYDYGHPFKDGIARVGLQQVNQLIDTKGTITSEETTSNYLTKSFGYEAFWIQTKEGQTTREGLLDKRGNILLEPIYSSIETRHLSKFGQAVVRSGDSQLKGIIDSRGNWLVPCQYESIQYFDNHVAIVYRDHKMGLVNTYGEEMTPLIYDEIFSSGTGLFAAKKGEKIGLLNDSGEEITPCIYDYISMAHEGRIKIRKDHKSGFLNLVGKEVVPCTYAFVTPYYQGISIVCQYQNNQYQYGLIDKTGKIIANLKYDNIAPFNRYGIAEIRQGSQLGWINLAGEEVIPPSYLEIHHFYRDRAEVTKIDNTIAEKEGHLTAPKYIGYINTAGQEIIPCIYEKITPYWNSFKVEKDQKTALVDRNYVFKTSWYEDITPIKGDYQSPLFVVRLNGKYGIIDSAYQLILPIEYHSITTNDIDFIKVCKRYKYGYLDRNGRPIIPVEYDKIDEKHNSNLLKVRKGQKEGLLDKNGNIIVPVEYDEVHYFRYNKAWVKRAGLTGLVNQKGKEMLPCTYQQLSWDDKQPAIIIAQKDGKYGVIDGNTYQHLTAFSYDKIQRLYLATQTCFLVNEDDKLGLLNVAGNPIIPIEYETITPLEGGVLLVQKKEQYGLYNIDGRLLTPIIYDELAPLKLSLTFISKKEGKYGLLSAAGTPLLNTEYDKIVPVGKLLQLQKANKVGLADETGKIILPSEYDRIDSKAMNLVLVQKGNKYGLIHTKTKNPTCDYDEIIMVNHYTFKVRKGDKWGIMNNENKPILPIVYEAIGTENLPYYLLKKDNQYNMSDNKGRLIYPTTYHSLRHFWLDYYMIQEKTGGLYGLIHINGKTVLPVIYDEIVTNLFQEDWLIVRQKESYGIVSFMNKVIIPIKYDSIRYLTSNLLELKKGNRYALVTETGKTLTDFIYEVPAQYTHNLILTKKGGKYGFINILGQIVIPFIYQEATPLDYYHRAKVTDVKGEIFYIDKNGNRILD